MAEHVLCEKCGVSILDKTADKNNGTCTPCARKIGKPEVKKRDRRKKSSINTLIIGQLLTIQLMVGSFGIAVLFLVNIFANLLGTGYVFRFVGSPILFALGSAIFIFGLLRLIRAFPHSNSLPKSLD